MRVAVIHDWLGPMTGAERVLGEILECFPSADVFTAIDAMAPEHRSVLRGHRVTASPLQHLAYARRHIWNAVPLMPWAMSQFDLRAYDLVLSNSHAVAKGVRTRPGQLHLCYLLSPMRFIWDLEPYYLEVHRIGRGPRRWAIQALFAQLRRWDLRSNASVSAFVACSEYVRARARRHYGIDCEVLYPPADLAFFTTAAVDRSATYLAASRLTPFKGIGAIVAAFQHLPDRHLIVIGDGPERARLEAEAGPNVRFLGRVDDGRLRDEMRRARAFLFAAPEDFGLVMVEAQACGTPVIALAEGGASEIVRTQAPRSGVLFANRDPSTIADAIRRFESDMPVASADCVANAQRFSAASFRAQLRDRVQLLMSSAQR